MLTKSATVSAKVYNVQVTPNWMLKAKQQWFITFQKTRLDGPAHEFQNDSPTPMKSEPYEVH